MSELVAKDVNRQTSDGLEARHIAFLRAHPLFQRISQRSPALIIFLREVKLRRFPKGELIYAQHEPAQAVYLVREGEVHIEHRDAVTHQSELIGIEGRGMVFGEVSLISGEPRSSYARAALDSSVYVIPGAAFLHLLAQEAVVAQALTVLLSQRLRQRIGDEAAAAPARVVVFVGPVDPVRSGRIAADLADRLVDEAPDRVALCAFGQGSAFHPDTDAGTAVTNLMTRWPQVTIEAIRDMLDTEGRRFDVLRGESLFLDEQQTDTVARIPALLGRLRKYYSLILVDVGADYGHPVLSRLISQCDRIVLVRPLEQHSPSSRERSIADEQWRAAAAACTELVPEFFDRVITVSDEAAGTSLAQLNAQINRDSALYRNHIRLVRDWPGTPEGTGVTYGKGLRRLARRLSGSSRGLCLGGGGARAFAHIGVLQVLEREGIEFDAVSGTSMGAIIGAAYAMGKDAAEIRQLLGRILPSAESILDKTLPLISFYRGRKLNQAILSGFGNSRFEELELPFFCNGADLNSGRHILFESGFLATALRASVSLPGVFPPLAIGGMRIIDGGVINNLPGDVLREKGHAVVIGVSVTPLEEPRSGMTTVQREKGAFGLLKGLRKYLSMPPILSIVYRSITMEGRELMRFRMDTFDHVLEPEVTEFDLFDFHRIDSIVERGRLETEQHLEQIREVLRTKRI